ncbi:hypothetical protein ACVSK3_15050, partial [Pseudomonas aeruginosa]
MRNALTTGYRREGLRETPISQMPFARGASKKSTNTSLMAVSESGLNAQADARRPGLNSLGSASGQLPEGGDLPKRWSSNSRSR